MSVFKCLKLIEYAYNLKFLSKPKRCLGPKFPLFTQQDVRERLRGGGESWEGSREQWGKRLGARRYEIRDLRWNSRCSIISHVTGKHTTFRVSLLPQVLD